MNNRQVLYFNTVAKHLSFTKAAKELYISQPTLSKSISDLEEALGVSLFKRTKNGITLTTAGEVFREESAKLVAQEKTMINKVKAAAQSTSWNLRVAHVGSGKVPILADLIKKFDSLYPMYNLSLEYTTWGDMKDKISKNQIDIGFTIFSDVEEQNPDMLFQCLSTRSSVLLVSDDHPLATRSSVSLTELSEERFILRKRGLEHLAYETFIAHCARAGFTPHIVKECDTMTDLLALIQAGRGICLVSPFYPTAGFPKIKAIPLMEGYPISLGLMYRKDTNNPAITDFIREALLMDWAD